MHTTSANRPHPNANPTSAAAFAAAGLGLPRGLAQGERMEKVTSTTDIEKFSSSAEKSQDLKGQQPTTANGHSMLDAMLCG